VEGIDRTPDDRDAQRPFDLTHGWPSAVSV
jgi:hypothetical protein